MFAHLGEVFRFLLLPLTAVLIGGGIAAFRTPSPRLQSMVQHFAAGVVFAAVAGEILPEIVHERAPVAVAIGFTLGVLAMLAVRQFTERLEARSAAAASDTTTIVIVVGIDLTIDGLLVGVGFAASTQSGILLTLALTIEILFLVLATIAGLVKAGAPTRQLVRTTLGLAALVTVGAVLGTTVFAGMAGAALTLVLAFGAAALLYLVTEELLVEAHEVPETPLTTAMFFVGFFSALSD